MEPDLPRLLLTADTVGGVWTYALELARAWGRRGTQVLLASSGPAPTSAQSKAAQALPNVFWIHRTASLEWMEQPWNDVAATGNWLLEWEERFSPDVVHLNDYSHGALPWNAPTLVVAHSCVLSWWRAVKGEEAPARYAAYKRRIAHGLRGASLVAAPSVAMLNALQEEYGVLEKTAVLSNGRSFPPSIAQEKAPLIFSAGRLWDEAKNITLLDEVAEELLWPVHVAGAARQGDGQERPLPHLHRLGPLSESEMRDALGRAAIYAAPALYEPFGLTILEAALSGCALVLADIPSLRELWDGAAVFAPPRDRAAWKKALNDLSSQRDKREHFAACAMKRAQQFSVENMVEAYAAAYAQLKWTAPGLRVSAVGGAAS